MAAKKIKRRPVPVKRKKKISATVKIKGAVAPKKLPVPKPLSLAPAPTPLVAPMDKPITVPAEGDTTRFLRREAERQDGYSAIKL